jgi:ParB family transcriptional regulator, chromosome partitioning protein
MPSPRGGLGKGLEALIPTGQGAAAELVSGTAGVMQVPVSQVSPNPRQPRTHFDSVELEELAASIREHGVLQPLIVSKKDKGSGYLLIAGERRLQASIHAGLKTVPVIVRQTTDQEQLLLALIENVQREDLNPLEEANAYHQLKEEFGLSHEEISSHVGKSRVAVTNTMRLLKLPKVVQTALVEEQITEGHARALLMLETPVSQTAALHQVVARDLSVRQTEDYVRRLKGEKPAAKAKPAPLPDIVALEERLQSALGTRVNLRHGKEGRGTLTLHFYSDEELNSLLDKLLE